jgi:hypothetical protein
LNQNPGKYPGNLLGKEWVKIPGKYPDNLLGKGWTKIQVNIQATFWEKVGPKSR